MAECWLRAGWRWSGTVATGVARFWLRAVDGILPLDSAGPGGAVRMVLLLVWARTLVAMDVADPGSCLSTLETASSLHSSAFTLRRAHVGWVGRG